MLDSTAVVAAERQGKNARQLLDAIARLVGDDSIALSVITVLELVSRRLPSRFSGASRAQAALPR